jgi:hypothetical protein
MRNTLTFVVLGFLCACNSVPGDPGPAAPPPGAEPASAAAGRPPGLAALQQARQAAPAPLPFVKSSLGGLVAASARLATSTQHNFEIHEPDGVRSLYSGQDVGWKAASARTITAPVLGSFARVRVPAALVERARNAKLRTLSLSLEDPRSTVEVLLHQPGVEGQPARDLVFRAGDPWVSGVVQIAIADNGTPLGLYRIARHHPPAASDGTIGSSYFETGIFEDAGLPTLKYWGSATRDWPALPAGWMHPPSGGSPAGPPLP